MNMRKREPEGIALVTAMLVSLAISLLILSTLYFVVHSTALSGSGKRYATAVEAADGSVEVMKNAIKLLLSGEPVDDLPIEDEDPPCLLGAVMNENSTCTVALTLPATGFLKDYSVRITVMRLHSSALPGSTLQFPPAGGGIPASATYFRINSVASGAGGSRAETSALYRHVS
jgi:hypothetical protein